MSREQKNYTFNRIMLRVIVLQIKAVPWHSALINLVGVFTALTITAKVIATQGLFDKITDAAAGNAGFIECLIPLMVLTGITFGEQILNGVSNFHVEVIFEKAAGKIKTLLHRKLKHLNPVCFEDPKFLDDLNKAREGIAVIPSFSITLFFILSIYIVYFASIGTYLYNLKPILLFTILISFIPALIAQIIRGKVFTKLEEESAPLRRENEYYQKTICEREYFKETRILGAFKYFYTLYHDTLIMLTHKRWKAENKTALIELFLNFATFAGMALSTYLLFNATIAGDITVGAFAAVFGALNMLFGLMREIVNRHIGAINRDIGKIVNFVRMMDAPERYGDCDGNLSMSEGIKAENVSFTYPGKETPAVSNVSLEIAQNETIAIVGKNGAGKSTLVRLLIGLYLPLEGKVLVGGLNTLETDPAVLFQRTSGVFQKFQRYKMTLSNNVAISNMADFNSDKIIKILKQAAVELKDIDIETMLSPEFDGIDLSGGEWQRLAIARGLYRTNRFIVLDEPTASIDPIEETRVFTQFKNLAKNKCAIIVTHRLGSAKFADRIIVMDSGKITDIGTHDELMGRMGLYADMWAKQAKWYEYKEEIS
ncbi:MAG: ABC transporter ATP-binding protein/permease [Lachnospiraceae bacterium]|nr:ABC transporter ATP-binding protein/permease [Lachnospiraceae bacterium]